MRKTTQVVWILVWAFACLPGGCSTRDRSSTSTEPTSRPDACSLLDRTVSVFGPLRYTRNTSMPATEDARFTTADNGEICIIVTNGLHKPPHGHRVSAASIFIDGVKVLGPEAFSQQVDHIQRPLPVSFGRHEISVELASKPESFLEIEIRFLREDNEPPTIDLLPRNGDVLDYDLPLVEVGYHDEGTGVDLASLSVFLDGVEITNRLSIGEERATWQVDIEQYLEEGDNDLIAMMADRFGNLGIESSSFSVQTPTEVLLTELDSPDERYRRRSAYKLLFRQDVLSWDVLYKCLNQLNHTPEPKAVDRLLEMLDEPYMDHFARALASGALGGAARVDPNTAQRADVIDALGHLLMEDDSFFVKTVAAQALGHTKNHAALEYLDSYLVNDGPNSPPVPVGDLYEKHLQYRGLSDAVSLQVVRAIIRIAGYDYLVGNPGDLEKLRNKYIDRLVDLLGRDASAGGRP